MISKKIFIFNYRPIASPFGNYEKMHINIIIIVRIHSRFNSSQQVSALPNALPRSQFSSIRSNSEFLYRETSLGKGVRCNLCTDFLSAILFSSLPLSLLVGRSQILMITFIDLPVVESRREHISAKLRIKGHVSANHSFTILFLIIIPCVFEETSSSFYYIMPQNVVSSLPN